MKPPAFTLRQLTYFVTAAKFGKIANAALEVGISQSAITTAILDLERSLGAQLFDRHATGVTLTQRGHMFLQHAQNVLGAAEDAQRWPFRLDGSIGGAMTLAVTHVVSGYFLLPLYSKFRANYPNAEIRLIERTRAECEAAVRSGEADLAVLLTSNLEDRDALDCATLMRSARQLWVASNSPLLQQKDVSLLEVEPLPYVFLRIEEGERVIRSHWANYGTGPNVQFRTDAMEAMREWIALGLGVTIVADTVYRPWSLDGRRIERLPIREGMPPMEIGIAWARDRDLPAVATAFRTYLTQTLNRVDTSL
jgi:DNA-binding transcriptional LysR family regulator